MFVGSITLGKGVGATKFELVVVPLKDTEMPGRWDASTDLLLICLLQTARASYFAPDDHFSRYKERLGIGEHAAKNLAEWVEKTFGGEDG